MAKTTPWLRDASEETRFSSNTGLDLDAVEKKLHELNEFGREKMDWSN
jgi:hypothetical protein